MRPFILSENGYFQRGQLYVSLRKEFKDGKVEFVREYNIIEIIQTICVEIIFWYYTRTLIISEDGEIFEKYYIPSRSLLGTTQSHLADH